MVTVDRKEYRWEMALPEGKRCRQCARFKGCRIEFGLSGNERECECAYNEYEEKR